MSAVGGCQVKKEVLLPIPLGRMAVLPPSPSGKKGVQAQSALGKEGADLLEALSNNLTVMEQKQHL
ncbi:hypothetical protein [Moorena sp. SIO4G3]|uniref:hypothetical protein n=1 Tax=Moorena sp. SIO4G3 TaxID=2607821 RepID=UPI00142A3016|nr:hypothetical protein [Moorena sp. SIO4G3]NEO80328.1 hypothetical protein [Moorena sp. SIO4G3]